MINNLKLADRKGDLISTSFSTNKNLVCQIVGLFLRRADTIKCALKELFFCTDLIFVKNVLDEKRAKNLLFVGKVVRIAKENERNKREKNSNKLRKSILQTYWQFHISTCGAPCLSLFLSFL